MTTTTTFKDSEQLYQCIGGLFDILKKHPEIGPKIKKSELIIRFKYTEPEGQIWIDCLNDPKEEGTYLQWYKTMDKEPIVDMSMKADIGHQFWLGNVNLLTALARKQIIAKGPIPKIIKLLPIIKPAYAIYPEHLKKIGYANLIKK
ncbi:MAG: hypothetical protein AABZ60_16205 [Planctomycetota bacterium]